MLSHNSNGVEGQILEDNYKTHNNLWFRMSYNYKTCYEMSMAIKLTWALAFR